VHHSPYRVDQQLDALCEQARAHQPRCTFSRCGEAFWLDPLSDQRAEPVGANHS
jgi:hypothetical protein